MTLSSFPLFCARIRRCEVGSEAYHPISIGFSCEYPVRPRCQPWWQYLYYLFFQHVYTSLALVKATCRSSRV